MTAVLGADNDNPLGTVLLLAAAWGGCIFLKVVVGWVVFVEKKIGDREVLLEIGDEDGKVSRPVGE